MVSQNKLSCVIAVLLSALATAAVADDKPTQTDTFSAQVQPVLQRHCGACHGADAQEHGLDLSSVKATLAGSETGAIVVPASAKESLLVQVLAKDSKPHMPPEGQLSDDEISVVARWIDGLDPATPTEASRVTAEDREHWAFQPIERVSPPEVVRADWSVTPIDRFVLARQEAAGLQPSPSADRATLLRRVYFALIGLPPSPEEVTAFLNNDRPDAYEQVVERLLASPYYGERWGRHWLDLARYADSGGFHNDLDRPHAWRYRDYVVDSFNADKPYGQFVTEQLAGDQLSEPKRDDWIATGFSRNGPSNDDNMGKTAIAKAKYRMDELDDIISTSGSVFLGLTIACARCHDHKFDPISQRDYYSFLAFFNTSTRQQLVLNSLKQDKPDLRPVPRKPDAKTALAMVLTDRGNRAKPTRLLWRGNVTTPGPVVVPAVPEVLKLERSEEGEGLTSRRDLAGWMTSPGNPLTWRVMANRLWHYHFGQGLVRTPSNFGRLAETPSHPQLLDWLANELRHRGSLKQLHRLIVTSAVYRQSSAPNDRSLAIDEGNRLLWRMNRRRLEAEPLRDAFLTVSGQLNPQMGGPGIYPRIRPELLVASQRNKWPTVKQEGPQHWRRSVYVYVKRQLQLPLLEMFDSPSTNHSCSERGRSLVPTQSLVLLNDEFVRQQSRLFADRVRDESSADPHDRINRAIQIAIGRQPSMREVNQGAAFISAQEQLLIEEGQTPDAARDEALADFCHVLMNLSEFVYVD
ncbi:MAG: PSD1 and planctomycete cytochrome C domain-containing protein [Planctomycetota bacterium]